MPHTYDYKIAFDQFGINNVKGVIQLQKMYKTTHSLKIIPSILTPVILTPLFEQYMGVLITFLKNNQDNKIGLIKGKAITKIIEEELIKHGFAKRIILEELEEKPIVAAAAKNPINPANKNNHLGVAPGTKLTFKLFPEPQDHTSQQPTSTETAIACNIIPVNMSASPFFAIQNCNTANNTKETKKRKKPDSNAATLDEMQPTKRVKKSNLLLVDGVQHINVDEESFEWLKKHSLDQSRCPAEIKELIIGEYIGKGFALETKSFDLYLKTLAIFIEKNPEIKICTKTTEPKAAKEIKKFLSEFFPEQYQQRFVM